METHKDYLKLLYYKYINIKKSYTWKLTIKKIVIIQKSKFEFVSQHIKLQLIA